MTGARGSMTTGHVMQPPTVHEISEQEYRRQRERVERSLTTDRPKDVYPQRDPHLLADRAQQTP